MQQAHRTWWKHYNREHHYAHREHQDGRHSPEAVLRGVLGRTYPDEVLSRVLYAMQFTRHLDAHGYVRFKNWRFFGEDGLAGEQVSVWMYEGTLKIEYQATALSEYALHLSPDHQHIEAVKNPRRIETHFLEGAAAVVADLRDRVAARVATARPGTASESRHARRAGTTTSASRGWCDWMKAFLCCSPPRREVRTLGSEHGTARLSKTSRSCEKVMPSPRKPLSSSRS